MEESVLQKGFLFPDYRVGTQALFDVPALNHTHLFMIQRIACRTFGLPMKPWNRRATTSDSLVARPGRTQNIQLSFSLMPSKIARAIAAISVSLWEKSARVRG
ncbi:hypothetical protein [Bordetella sp. LUAb4]|uniref:hypothetical protein n=1 Tax=Bordetella sp. LUAb4 TaxID=2843195 RepID=UPI001E4D5EFC|nr:hypothetical protein [Bordetella sp. LUAb4]